MTRRVFAILAISAVFFCVWCHSHEPPHLKYTREMNEKAANEVDDHDHHHHDHAHFHDHDHDHHHDHDPDHFHDHDHDHHHDHDHDHFHDHDHDHHHDHDHDHHHDHPHVHDHAHDHDHTEHIHIHSHSHEHVHKPTEPEKFIPYPKDSIFAFLNDAKIRLWTYSVGATLVISAFPFFILAFIPIQANSSESDSLLKVLLAFGAGGLLGDAFLHLIPHASGGHDHGHEHHHHGPGEEHEHVHDMSVGFWVLGGLLTFFVVEKFVRILRGEDDHHHHGHSHGHSHSHKSSKTKTSEAEESDDEKSESDVKKDKDLKNRPAKKEVEKKKEEIVEVPRQLAVAAFLNVAADFLHNFTDGLAIGASFIAGSTVGFVTMLTVLFHEVPHEIGDFAILIQSGFSKKKAMFTQLMTALGALLGCVISLWSVDAYELAEAAQSSWVLPFTAGGFIYIATVSVLPELLEKSSFLLSIFEVVALAGGVFVMYLVAFFE